MRGRLLFIVGLGAGYVLGARAGRQRYEQIASAASKVWNSDAVSRPREQAVEFVQEQSPKVASAAADAASKALNKVTKRKA